ncbi:MAG: TonB C-terminal domain-containing protein [Campylobacterales bacterium]|nr:TonB C-terminal domain-containing protein [Campylobacterales bacterium]
MDNNSNYFYISGFISFSLFFVFLLLFVIMLFDVKKNASYALNKDNYVSVSIQIPTVSKPKTTKAPKAVSAPVQTTSESKNIDVNDLFSDVWTKKIVKQETKKVNSKRLLEIQKKIKTVEANDVKKIHENSENTQESDASKEELSESKANEVNEYLAKIQAIVYQYFNVPANSQGYSVKTLIELNALGKMLDFRILSYSQNSALNSEADKIKERLKNVVFPVNPQNRSSRTVVILISKE